MSVYMMNKLLRDVEMHNSAIERYASDSRGFVTNWLSRSGSPARASDDHDLTQEEAAAFKAFDYGALYRLGINPYLLWHFVEAVDQGNTPWPELKEQYRAIVTKAEAERLSSGDVAVRPRGLNVGADGK